VARPIDGTPPPTSTTAPDAYDDAMSDAGPAPAEGAREEIAGSASAPVVAAGSSALVPLESLAPRYEKSQHNTYLKRLQEAVKDPKNRNIALTGRYGAGKSSVLEKFTENHPGTTLRLAISTLGPNAEEVTLTNRIEKELVKQLLYSAAPRTLRHSRFSRITPLSKVRAFGESLMAVVLLGSLLALLGWLPPVAGTDTGQSLLAQVAAWALFGALTVVVVAVVRLMTHDRFGTCQAR
jgi:hypothetical protein